ncbi:hypothetical protein HMN09_00787100 [Mycena chlorophos]|uniref:Uncharacterized protein n=1 Tax=Mycena chlorophos TaxID=658473 RepID=A0A8H6SW05_MYCCL|nr:hypothetical protein HMN09_00787100 [Mycena chlorophos]
MPPKTSKKAAAAKPRASTGSRATASAKIDASTAKPTRASEPAKKKSRVSDAGTENGVDTATSTRSGDKEDTESTTTTTTKTTASETTASSGSKRKRSATVSASASSTQPNAAPSNNAFTSGNFDLYNMELPFLQKALKPSSSSALNYTALRTLIREKQTKSDKTAKIVLSLPSSDANGYGRLCAAGIRDPMEEMPFDIGLASVRRVDNISFTPAQKAALFPKDTAASTSPSGSGLEGSIVLVDQGCGISSFTGTFKLCTVPLAGTGDDAVYVGAATIDAKYSSMYSRRGHGSGFKLTFGFWAVRALGDDKDKKKLKADGLEWLANKEGGASGSASAGHAGYDDDDDEEEGYDSDPFGFFDDEEESDDDHGHVAYWGTRTRMF